MLPADECSYIIGNPPFYGARNQTQQQKDDLISIWVDGDGNTVGSPGLVDYVAGWFFLASRYMQQNRLCRTAFVSTNSIIQGEQVELVWHNLKRLFDIDFDFAYPTFVWSNEAIDQAHVHCVIIGYSIGEKPADKTLFYPDGRCIECPHINGYLLPAPDVYLKRVNKSICGMPQMSNGNRAYDGNNLVMTVGEKDELIKHSPDAMQWIRQYFMGADLIRNEPRYVLWLDGVDPMDIARVSAVSTRVEAVRTMREASKNQSTKKAAQTPHLFQTICQPKERYLAFPRVSSSRREYLPIAFLEPDVICGDKLIIVPNANLYVFGMLSSKAHKLWTWIFAGRLKSDISYSSSVYNNYPWPVCDAAYINNVEECAQRVLDSRMAHPDDSLAALYDPDKMPDDLRAAHAALDAAVEAAYGVDFGGDEEKVVAHLFKLYAQTTGEE